MSGSEHARPVWLTEELRTAIQAASGYMRGQGYPKQADALREVVTAWDAAPADPEGVVENVLRGHEHCQLEAAVAALAVLRALGAPS